MEDEDMDSGDDSVIINFQGFQREESYKEVYISHSETRAATSGLYSINDILLDTGFTCSVFNNEKMLIDMKRKKNEGILQWRSSGFSVKGLFTRFLQSVV